MMRVKAKAAHQRCPQKQPKNRAGLVHLKHNYPWNVLVFPAASEVGLEIHRALRNCKEVILHGANQAGQNIAEFVFKRMHRLPPVYESDCLPRLQELITTNNIDAIFPAHDDVLLWLANRTDRLSAAVISSSAQTCSICRSKQATYKALRDVIRVPKLLNTQEQPVFPVFVKPDCGQGSYRARCINDNEAFKLACAREPDLIVMEHLPGREYTIDCFSTKDAVIFSAVRERQKTKTGIATLSRPIDMPIARTWAERISEKLDLQGAWFFQMKEDSNGKPCLLEVSPRIAGSMALSRAAGPNFPLLSLYGFAGHSINIEAFHSEMRMGRSLDVKFIYDRPIEALYIDFDDTLVVNGNVNTRMISLIFQCRNRNIPVCLLTHHPGNLEVELTRTRLAGLFDRIIHIPDPSEAKADFITEKNAVFVDDSFRERSEAAKLCGVRCFDAAGAECLLDERS